MPYRALLILLTALACACSNAPGGGGAEEAYARGVSAFERAEPRTARIEFLNAIKAAPNDPRYRLMQARNYLQLGDGVAAEAELVRARQLGLRPEEMRHLIAHALSLQEEHRQALEEAKAAPPRHSAYAARIRGRSLSALGKRKEATAAFKEARAGLPADSGLWTDIARHRRSRNLPAAIKAADRAIALQPRNIEALALRGDLAGRAGGERSALRWYDRALALDPQYLSASLKRAGALRRLGEYRGMLAEARRAHRIAPEHPMPFYLQSLLAAYAGKFALARSVYQLTGGAFDRQPRGMLLLGATHYHAGNSEQAIDVLERLVAERPRHRKGRRLLAAAYWRAGEAKAAAATLKPLAARADADPFVLTLMGRALTRSGDPKAAAAYFARARGERAGLPVARRGVRPAARPRIEERAPSRPTVPGRNAAAGASSR